MSDISDMDWAQHILMDYAQNQRKDPNTAKKDPNKIYTGYCQLILQFYNTSNLLQFDQNCNFYECFATLGIRKNNINMN